MSRPKKKMEPLTQEQKELLDKNIPLVWWEVRRHRPRSDDQASEWVQEAVFGAARAIQTHDPEKGSLATWIVMYVRGVVLKLKKNKECTIRLGHNVESIGGRYTPKDKDEHLEIAVRSLDRKDKSLIEMRFNRGLGLKEMGGELGISTEGARLRLNRALVLVKREFCRLEGIEL